MNGTYLGYLKSGALTTTSKGGAQMAILFNVAYVAAGAGWNAFDPPIDRTVYLSLSDAAWQYTEQKLKGLGFNGNFDDPEFSEESARDGVELICREEDYNDKKQEKWDLAKWGEKEKPAADIIKRFEAKWRSSVGGSARPAGRPTTPPVAARVAAPAAAPPATTATEMLEIVKRTLAAPAPAALAVAEPLVRGTKDFCWALFLEYNPDGEQDRWRNLLALRGKPETAFTREDWLAVEKDLAEQVPF